MDDMFEEGHIEEKKRGKHDQLVLGQGFLCQLSAKGQKTIVKENDRVEETADKDDYSQVGNEKKKRFALVLGDPVVYKTIPKIESQSSGFKEKQNKRFCAQDNRAFPCTLFLLLAHMRGGINFILKKN
jgi:hypothetical protein